MLLRTSVPVMVVAAVLIAGVPTGIAGTDEEAIPAEGATIVLNDGTVIGIDDTVTFTFEGDKPEGEGDVNAMACPEVNDRPKYTVTGKPRFMPENGDPKSSWLLPGQSVKWTITGSHSFTWEIGAGLETEASAIVAKAKVKIDTKISNTWTWTGSQEVYDKNDTKKGYRAVLGQVGWKLTGVKTWIVPPCKAKKKTVVVYTPRKGDLSIGRQNK